MKDRIVLEPERKERTGVSPVTCWRMEQKGEFPKRRRISKGRVGWLESELIEWMESRPVSDHPEPPPSERKRKARAKAEAAV